MHSSLHVSSAFSTPSRLALALAALASFVALPAVRAAGDAAPSASDPAPAKMPADSCPSLGWSENLPNYLKPDAAFPTDDTPVGARDCAFHQWSWEAFTWAMAPDASGVPRFLGLHTPEDLFLPGNAAPHHPHALSLGTRGIHATAGHIEGAGAIVEADGNLLVAPNGYPVYASVHMNDAYFATAKRNLIANGGYQAHPDADYFPVGAAVFKATWLRLAEGEQPPAGAYVTEADVPVLAVSLTPNNTLYAQPTGATQRVKVALLGLHVVGQTIDHPEFVWATFEHHDNTPRFPDGPDKPAGTASDPKTYTLYAGGTPFAQTNLPSSQTTAASTSTSTPLSTPSTTISTTTTLTQTPRYTFDTATQRFSPTTNAVLENATGSETFSPDGPAHIAAVNTSAHTFFAGRPAPLSDYAHYDLIGTVWMPANTYSLASSSADAIGSVNLANSTAETFEQNATGLTTPAAKQNCFSCHNPQTFQNVAPMPNLVARRIALSHVLAAGTLYAVPNQIVVGVPAGTVK